MALQSITELDSHSSFYNILVFVFPHVFVIVFVFPSFTMTSIPKSATLPDPEHIPSEAQEIKVY